MGQDQMLVTIITAVITALTGGVVAAFFTYRLNANREHVFFMRRKAEELFLSAQGYHRQLGTHFYSYIPLLQNEISYNQHLDLRIEHSNKSLELSTSNFDNVEMITRIYFPQIHDRLDAMHACREKVFKITRDYKRAYERGEQDRILWLQPFQDYLEQLDRSMRTFERAIIDEARHLAATERVVPPINYGMHVKQAHVNARMLATLGREKATNLFQSGAGAFTRLWAKMAVRRRPSSEGKRAPPAGTSDKE